MTYIIRNCQAYNSDVVNDAYKHRLRVMAHKLEVDGVRVHWQTQLLDHDQQFNFRRMHATPQIVTTQHDITIRNRAHKNISAYNAYLTYIEYMHSRKLPSFIRAEALAAKYDNHIF